MAARSAEQCTICDRESDSYVDRHTSPAEFVQSPVALKFRPWAGRAGENGARDVPADAYDHIVARARFREFRDQRTPVIVPSRTRFRFPLTAP
jgi:hypothetical protein